MLDLIVMFGILTLDSPQFALAIKNGGWAHRQTDAERTNLSKVEGRQRSFRNYKERIVYEIL